MSDNIKRLNEEFQEPELYNAFVTGIMQCFKNLAKNNPADILRICMLLDPYKALGERHTSALENYIEDRAYRIARNLTNKQLELFGELCEKFGDQTHSNYVKTGERFRHISQEKPFVGESYKGRLNELDARTYASYANKRRQQSKTAVSNKEYLKASDYNDRAYAGEQAARDAWNKKYARDENINHKDGRNPGYYKKEMTGNDESPYAVHTQSLDSHNTWEKPHSYAGYDTEHSGSEEGKKVAREMSKGTGKYNKEKGVWESNLTEREQRLLRIAKRLNENGDQPVNEGRIKNAIAGGILGAASMFGGLSGHAQNTDNARQGMPENWGTNVEQVAKNLQKAGYDDVRIKNDNLVLYQDQNGKVHFVRPSQGEPTEKDSIKALICTPNMAANIEKAVKDGVIDLLDYQTIPTDYNLISIYKKAEQDGYGKDDFMLYFPHDSNVGFILPNTTSIKEIKANPSLHSMNGLH